MSLTIFRWWKNTNRQKWQHSIFMAEHNFFLILWQQTNRWWCHYNHNIYYSHQRVWLLPKKDNKKRNKKNPLNRWIDIKHVLYSLILNVVYKFNKLAHVQNNVKTRKQIFNQNKKTSILAQENKIFNQNIKTSILFQAECCARRKLARFLKFRMNA